MIRADGLGARIDGTQVGLFVVAWFVGGWQLLLGVALATYGAAIVSNVATALLRRRSR